MDDSIRREVCGRYALQNLRQPVQMCTSISRQLPATTDARMQCDGHRQRSGISVLGAGTLCVGGGSTRGPHTSPSSLAVLYYLVSSFYLSLGRMLGSLKTPLQQRARDWGHSLCPGPWVENNHNVRV